MPYFLVRLAALLSTQHIPAARPRSQRTLVSPGAGRGQGPVRSAVFRYGIWIWKTEFSSHAISRTTVLSHNPFAPIWSPSCKSIWHTAREKRMNRSFHPMRISQWPKTVCAAVLPTTTGDAGKKDFHPPFPTHLCPQVSCRLRRQCVHTPKAVRPLYAWYDKALLRQLWRGFS